MIDDILLPKICQKERIDEPMSIYLAAVDYQKKKIDMIDSYFVDEMDEKLEPLTDDEIRLAYAKTENSL